MDPYACLWGQADDEVLFPRTDISISRCTNAKLVSYEASKLKDKQERCCFAKWMLWTLLKSAIRLRSLFCLKSGGLVLEGLDELSAPGPCPPGLIIDTPQKALLIYLAPVLWSVDSGSHNFAVCRYLAFLIEFCLLTT